MFYNHSFLTRRSRGSLGIVWLAATLGRSRSALKRITKREIEGVDIGRACESVASPPQPIALRLSSQLMYGVVRVYSHQSEQLLADTTAVHANVRKSLTFASAGGLGFGLGLVVPCGENIDMPAGAGAGAGAGKRGKVKAKGSAGTLTLRSDAGFFFAGDFDAAVEYDWAWQMHLDGLGLAGDASAQGLSQSGIASGQLAQSTEYDESHAGLATPPPHAHAGKSRFTAAKEKITLPSPLGYGGLAYGYGDGDADGEHVGAARGAAAGRDSTALSDLLQFGNDDNGQPFGDLDMGLDLGLADDFGAPPPPLPLDLGADGGGGVSSNDSSFMGGVGASAGAGDMGLDLGLDMGLGFDDGGFEQLPLPVDVEGKAQGADGDAARPRKKRKVTFNPEDPRIELSGREVRQQPDAYLANMAQAQAEKAEREHRKHMEALVKQKLLFAPPSDLIEGSSLIEYWNVTVGGEAQRLENLVTDYKKRLASGAAVPPLKRGWGRDAPNGHSNFPNATGMGMGGDAGDNPFGGAGDDSMAFDAGFPDDFGGGGGVGGEGFGQGADAPSSGGDGGDAVGGDDSLISAGVGRRDAGSAVGNASTSALFPWNVFGAARDGDTSLSFRFPGRGAGGGSGSNTPRSHRSLSVGSAGAGGMAGNMTATGAILARVGAAEGGAAGDESWLGAGSTAAAAAAADESQIARMQHEKEAQNFLEFAKSMASEVQPHPLFFSDLAPVAATPPTVAAQAFYHVLQMATNQLASVGQDEAYGEIHIEIAGVEVGVGA